MKKLLQFLVIIIVSLAGESWGQTTIFSDNFNSSQSASYSTSGTIGASSWTVSRSGDDWGARIHNNILELTNDAGATANVNGWIYVNYSTSLFNSPYNTTLKSNTSLVTWSFNMRQIRIDPAGFGPGNYGVAFILGSTSQTASTIGNGYAVVLGQNGATDPIRLAKFNNGLQGTLTNILESNTTGLTDFGAEYLSVVVTYNPSNDQWELFVRNDGTTIFADPASGTLTSQRTIIDNTYTSITLSYLGAYWQGSTAANQTAFFDNISIVVAPPAAPVAIAATNITTTSFTANWGSVADATKYFLDVSTASDFPNYVSGYENKDVGNALTANVTGLTAGTEYYYRVRANNEGGTNSNSNVINLTTIPNAPVAAAATNVTSSGFTANWGSSSGAAKYFLDVSTASDFPNYVSGYENKDVGNALTANVTGLTAGTEYYYRVRANNEGGTSSNSNVINLTTLPNALDAPVAIAATNITTTSFTANWGSVADAAKYFLDVSTASDFPNYVSGYENKDVGNALTANVTGLTAGTEYYYRVRANNEGGTSGNSNAINLTTIPNAPVAAAATNVTSSGFTANWNSSSGATKYFLDVPTASDFSNYVSGYNNKDVGNVLTANVTGLTSGTEYYYRVRANNAGGTSGNSNVINLTTIPNPPAKYLVTTSNNSPAAGSQVTITAQLSDQYNNPVQISGKIVTFTSINGGTFLSNTNVTDGTGKAAVTFSVSTTAGTTHTIIAADNTTPTALTGTSGNITVHSAAAVKYIVSVSDHFVGTGSTITASAQLADQYNNNVKTAGKIITWTSTNGGTFSSPTSTTNTDGIAAINFTTSSFNGIAHKITATDESGLTGSSAEIYTVELAAPLLLLPGNDSKNINQKVLLKWSMITDADAYQIWLSKQSNFSSSATQVIDTWRNEHEIVLDNGQVYYWKVRAKKGSVISVWSDSWSFTTIPLKPERPVLFLPLNGEKKIVLNPILKWTEVKFAESYNVQVAENSDFSNSVVDLKNIRVTSAQISGLKYKTEYFWRVNGVNIVGAGEYSTTWSFKTTDTLAAPSELKAEADTSLSISLTWKDNSNNETGFMIERAGPNSDTYTEFVSLTANTTKYLDKNLSQGKTYKYRVKSFNADGVSLSSNIAQTTIPNVSIKPPSSLTTKINSSGHIELTWKDNSNNEKGFIIEREEDISGINPTNKISFSRTTVYIPIATVAANTTKYIDVSTKEGLKYHYRVCAFNDDGFTFPVPAFKPILPLNAPTNLKVETANKFVALVKWQDRSDFEEGFELFRSTKRNILYSFIYKGSANTNYYLDTTVYDGRKFYYKVHAFTGEHGISAPSNIDSVFFAMSAPSNFKAAQIPRQNRVKLTWKDNSKSELGYLIERKIFNETRFTEIARVNSNVETFTDEAVANKQNYLYRIKCFNEETESNYANEENILVSFEKENIIPTDVKLFQNYPNPFNPTTTISYFIPKRTFVRLQVFDMLAKEIVELVNKTQEAGLYEVIFDGSSLPSGAYFYKLEAGPFVEVKKLLLVK